MFFLWEVQEQCLPQPHWYLLRGGIAATQVCIFANMVMEWELNMLWIYIVCMTQLFSCYGETQKMCCDSSGGIKLLKKNIKKHTNNFIIICWKWLSAFLINIWKKCLSARSKLCDANNMQDKKTTQLKIGNNLIERRPEQTLMTVCQEPSQKLYAIYELIIQE